MEKERLKTLRWLKREAENEEKEKKEETRGLNAVFPRRVWEKEGHEHQLALSTRPFQCDGCGEKETCFGVGYRCERCDYDVHPYCLKLGIGSGEEGLLKRVLEENEREEELHVCKNGRREEVIVLKAL